MVTSVNLEITHVETSQSSKEVTVNQAVDDLDGAISDQVSQTVTDGADTVLTDAVALRTMHIGFAGALTADRNVIVPNNKKFYQCRNGTTGGFNVTVKTSAGSGIILRPGEERWLRADGTNVVAISRPIYTISEALATMVGEQQVFEVTVGQAALASAGTVALITAKNGEQWKVREIFLSGAGTNFSGGGGDRDLDIKEASTIYATVPAATLQTLAAARWGDGGVPFPATAAHLTAATAAGADLVAAYSGGTADYTAGALTLIIVAERAA